MAKRPAPPSKDTQQTPTAPTPELETLPPKVAVTTKLSKTERELALEEAYELPYDPPDYHFAPSDDPMAEMAARELCRRKLLPFIQRFRPAYDAAWVHADICRRLERFVKQVEAKECPRLLLMMPVRHGKSEICSRHFPAWVLGHHPEWEIIAASGAQSLAMSFSRYGRDLVSDPAYTAVFPNTQLHPASKSVENWGTTKGGGYLAAGIGTMITGRGAHCFPAGTKVRTTSGYAIIDHLKIGDKVIGYDHETRGIIETSVEATQITEREDLIEVVTSAGRRIVATPEHPFYIVGEGYVEAQFLGVGSRVLVADMPSVRVAEGENVEAVSRVFLCSEEADCGASVRLLRTSVRKASLRLQKIAKSWAHRALLLKALLRSSPRCKESQTLPGVRQTCYIKWEPLPRGEVLLRGMQKSSVSETLGKADLPSVFRRVSASLTPDSALFTRMCQRGSQRENVGHGELELQGRSELQSLVSSGSGACVGEGRDEMLVVRRDGASGCSPHKQSANGQSCGEPYNAVSELSRSAPQVREDTISVVKRIRSSPVKVYDLQVAGTSNFFAEEILVHNCLIIDDPVRDGEAADSPTIRENVWEWYMSTAYTRLAPGGGVLGVLTWWNEDDWAGRIQQVMATGGGDTFEIVKYPALNDYGDEYLLPDDSIAQFSTDDAPPPVGATLLRRHNSALHPNRIPAKELLMKKANYLALGQKRWWDALFQQNPTPDDGDYFTPEMFRYYSTAPDRREMYIYQAWDFAISTDQKNDFTVGTTVGVDHRGSVYVLDVRRFKSSDGIHIANTIVDYAKEYDPTLIGFEDGQIWRTLEAQFLRSCDEGRVHPSHETLKPLTDKLVRASPLRGQMQAGRVYFDKNAHWFSELYKEFLRFGAGGVHDDMVDSLAWAIRLTLSRIAPREKRFEPKLKSWKDDLNRFLDTGGASHMCS